jgi:glycosyltransferase involved in cell wall biosynthesis
MLCASVIICTHNPRPHYLPQVLEALRNQTLPLDRWELLLVDNASKEPLTASSSDISWHPYGRHVREEKVGLSSARLCGMREASSDLCVFVDDDNVLNSPRQSESRKNGLCSESGGVAQHFRNSRSNLPTICENFWACSRFALWTALGGVTYFNVIGLDIPWLHTLKNEPDFPVVVWALARK